MKKKGILLLMGATLVLLIFFKLLANKRKLNQRDQLPAVTDSIRIPVTTTIVTEEQQTIQLVKTGVIVSYKHITLLAPANGYVLQVLFTPGSRVVKGQPLLVIDTRLLQTDLARATLHIARLKKEVDTYTELYEGKAATAEKLSEVKALYQDAENDAVRLRKQIADATIKAPEAGIMGAREAEEGEFVNTGASVGTISNQSFIKVKVQLTESQVYAIRMGQKVLLTTAQYAGKALVGTVTFMSTQANETYNYEVEITVHNKPSDIVLLPGTLVNAAFSQVVAEKALLIPREALIDNVQDKAVYVVRHGRAQVCPVTTGAAVGYRLQVLEGLTPGSEVITSGQINLRNGALIQLSKQQQ